MEKDKTEEVELHTWENVTPCDGGIGLSRVRVPGGWLYVSMAWPDEYTEGSVPAVAQSFVPDEPRDG